MVICPSFLTKRNGNKLYKILQKGELTLRTTMETGLCLKYCLYNLLGCQYKIFESYAIIIDMWFQREEQTQRHKTKFISY